MLEKVLATFENSIENNTYILMERYGATCRCGYRKTGIVFRKGTFPTADIQTSTYQRETGTKSVDVTNIEKMQSGIVSTVIVVVKNTR